MLDYKSEPTSLAEYIQIFKRRKYHLFVPALVVAVLAVMVALSWPATYLSTTTIRVEDRTLHDNQILSAAVSSGAQRIRVIQQQILTTARINDIIKKLNLYPKMSDTSSSKRAAVFRKNVLIEMIDSPAVDPSSGRQSEATIAFILGFRSKNADTAQKVTEELTTLFLEENDRSRNAAVSSVSEFYSDEVADLAKELSQREAELAQFKEANAGALPESYQYNLGALERTEQQLSDVDRRIKDTDQEIIRLTAELAQLDPYSTTTLPSGEVVMTDEERLRALQLEYKRKSDIYSDVHPDLIRLRREIKALEASLGVKDSDPVPDYPEDVSKATNPAYVVVNTRLRSAQTELNSLSSQKKSLQENREKFRELVRRAPEVEREYKAVVRGYESASSAYNDIKKKQSQAELAKSAEEGNQMGQFSIIEPASYPVEPESPNRVAILVLGWLFAGVAGVGVVTLAEIFDLTVRGAKGVASIAGSEPLVAIPYINNSIDLHEIRRQRRLMLAGAIAVAVVLVLFIHFFVKPLGFLA